MAAPIQPPISTTIQPLIEALFAGVEANDLEAALAPLSDDVIFYDPHYPYPDMNGIAEVREGITWGLGGMQSMRFDIERWFFSADGLSATIEVATHHVMNAGKRHLDFPQVFVFDTDGTKITKVRAYEPYGPGGGVGIGLGIAHRIYRLSHRKPR